MHGYLRHLANFAFIVDAGSISGAARRLDTSASSLSDSLKILEAHFSEPLVERRRSGVVPTSRGAEIYTQAQTIVGALNTAMRKPEGDVSGEVRVSLPGEVLENGGGAALLNLASAYPELRLVLHAEEALIDHTRFARDLYIRIAPGAPPKGLTVMASGETTAAMVCAPSLLGGRDPAQIVDVETLPVFTSPRVSQISETHLSDGTVLKMRNLLQVNTISARLHLARDGVAALRCLRFAVAPDLASGRLVELLPGRLNMRVPIHYCTPFSKPPHKVRVVAEAFSEAIEGRMGKKTSDFPV